MSCDWEIHCADCGSAHRFDDANHKRDMMLCLIGLAREIASLAQLQLLHGTQIDTGHGRVDATWFAAHLDHNLIAKSEYGDVMTADGRCG